MKFHFIFFISIYTQISSHAQQQLQTIEPKVVSAEEKVDFKNKIIASVNGVKITLSEYLETLEAALAVPTHKKIQYEDVLQFIIDRNLVIQKAYKEKVDSEPLVKAKMEDVLFGAQISKELQSEFEKITISTNEVEQYYKNNKEYKTSQILLRLPVMPKKEDVKNLFKAVNVIYQEVKNDPSKFEEIAKKYSETPAEQTNGDIGFQPPTSLLPEYFEAINGKQVGFLTPPVRTLFGYHIIKITGVREFKEINLGLYQKILFDIKRDTIIEKYYQELRKKANIVINKENLPKE